MMDARMDLTAPCSLASRAKEATKHKTHKAQKHCKPRSPRPLLREPHGPSLRAAVPLRCAAPKRGFRPACPRAPGSVSGTPGSGGSGRAPRAGGPGRGAVRVVRHGDGAGVAVLHQMRPGGQALQQSSAKDAISLVRPDSNHFIVLCKLPVWHPDPLVLRKKKRESGWLQQAQWPSWGQARLSDTLIWPVGRWQDSFPSAKRPLPSEMQLRKAKSKGKM